MVTRFSKRLDRVQYAIREMASMAKEVEKKGKKVIYLNIGDPLKFDFDTPSHIKEALWKTIKEGKNYYSESKGIYELREAICEKEEKYNGVKLNPEHVLVTQGVAEGINLVISVFVDPGDEVLVPSPTYPSYIGMTRIFNGRPIEYRCNEEEGWKPDLEDIKRKISERTKLIVLISPNNPTGAVYSEKLVKEILDISAEYEIPVVSDEIYDRIVYESRVRSVASLSKDSLVIGLNGFSKIYLMTGWRLGYVYVHDPSGEKADEIINRMLKYAVNRLCPNTPVQYAGIEALRGSQKHIDEMVEKLRRRRDYSMKRIAEISGLEAVKPGGTFYIFPKITSNKWKSDEEYAMELLKQKGVFVSYGSGFGEEYGKNHFRMVFLPEVEVLEEAFNKIEEFMSSG